MDNPLTIAVAQPRCVLGDVGANAAIHAAIVRTAGARLVIFPELSLTGYRLNAEPLAETDKRLTTIVRACAETGTEALVGAPVRGESGREYIATLAIDGDGVAVAYRKMNLTETEAKRFTPGTRPVVWGIEGRRLGLAVCRDVGTPGHAAAIATRGIDAYVAGIVMSTEAEQRQSERAAAIAAEHRVWVAIASFAGNAGDGFDEAAGCSGVWAPGGQVVSRAGREAGAVALATLA